MNLVHSDSHFNFASPKGLTSALRCGMAALALLPLAAAAGPNDAITLRMKFKTGDVSDYQTTVQFTIDMSGLSGKPKDPKAPSSPQPGNMTQQMMLLQHIKVVKVLTNGNGQVEVTTTNAQSGGASKPVSMTYDPLGNIVSMQNAGTGGGLGGMMFVGVFSSNAAVQGAYLPSKAVKPGDTWTQKVTIPGNAGTGMATAKYIKMTTVGRFNTAHIQSTLTLPIKVMMDAANQPTTAEKAVTTSTGTVNMTFENDFAVAEGKLVRSAGNGTMSMTTVSKASSSTGSATGTPPKMTFNVKLTSSSNLTQK